jgi:hypothetical protein
MKTLILVLVVATTGLAVASVQFYRQASSERARADAEVALRQKHEARIHELEQSRASLEEQLLEAQRPLANPAAASVVATPAASAPAAGIVSRLDRRDATRDAGGTFFQRPIQGRGPMDSEAGRRFMQTQMRGSIRRLYQDVGRDLNLTQDQANKLIELMADQQTRNFDVRRQQPDRAAAAQAWQQIQEQNNKEVTALLGDAKMAEFKAYQQTLPQRSQVDSVGQQLENAGLPLSTDQRSQLVTALIEEAQANPRPSFAPGLPPEEAQKQLNEWQDAYDKSVQDRAKQVLSSEQYARYHDYTEWMAEMRKNMPARAARFINTPGNAGPNVTFQLAVPDNAVAVAPAPPPRQ